MITFTFEEPVFHYNINILIGDSNEIQNYNYSNNKFRSYILACMANDKNCGTIRFTDSRQGKQIIIYSNNNVALINRQIFNAVMMMLNNEKIYYNDNNSNLFASLIEFYTNNVFNALHEYLEKDALEVANENNTYFLSLKPE